MRTIFQNYFKFDKTERQVEIDFALKQNIACKEIDHIVLVLKKQDTTELILSDKIELIFSESRPTYTDMFTIINKHSSDSDVNILANSDIFFDSTITLTDSIIQSNKRKLLEPEDCFALLRYEFNDVSTAKLYECKDGNKIMRYCSQDVWIFRGKIKCVDNANFFMGVRGCDNAIAFILKKSGYKVSNPCFDIKTYHVHASNIRDGLSNKKQELLNLPMMYVKPTRLKKVKTAIVTRFRNRLEFLKESLPSWLKYGLTIDTITVTDWNSSIENFNELLKFFKQLQDDRIQLVRVENKNYFDRSQAHNIGIQATDADLLFLIDCDVKVIDGTIFNLTESKNNGLNDDLIDRNDDLFFYTTRDLNKRGLKENYLYGSCVVWKSQWGAINGYYEGFSGYGYEDHDFFDRLIEKGFREKDVLGIKKNQLDEHTTEQYLLHMPHENDLRWIHHKNKNNCIEMNMQHAKKLDKIAYQYKEEVQYKVYKYPYDVCLKSIRKSCQIS
jgi:hypothetical protein